jgi:hypothetical protein
MMKELTLIGRAERVDFPGLHLERIPAKIDTGADSSSIWANAQLKRDGTLEVVFFAPESPFYTGEVHTYSQDEYEVTRVSNSFGQREVRYKLWLSIVVNGRRIRGSFTLADRATKLYPILLGRRLLNGKFLVDVSQGQPLLKEERQRRHKLEKEIKRNEGKLA